MKIDVIRHSEWAHVTLAVTPNGFSTGLLFHRDKAFQVDLDVYESRILLNVEGNLHAVPLENSKSIKTYFEEIFEGLASKGIDVTINPKPQEMTYKTNLNEGRHAAYVQLERRSKRIEVVPVCAA
ncbi:DUF5996 family protein [Planococcus sp. ISL-109]|uniref:DUF5996 family protein n=1 Tax=Planococcus sp. ISL-109 TaxID=2819166 RepID=UPI0020357019|nr:DUF5996 family protein [Planococcus sp. ISL-109]